MVQRAFYYNLRRRHFLIVIPLVVFLLLHTRTTTALLSKNLPETSPSSLMAFVAATATTTDTIMTKKTTVTTDDAIAEATPLSSTTTRRQQQQHIVLVRHGRSVANEYMAEGGPNEWGMPTFRDNSALADSPLSPTGEVQARQMQSSFLKTVREVLPPFEQHNDDLLIVVSPLTRTLQTLHRLVLPCIQEHYNNNNDNRDVAANDNLFRPHIIAHPLGTERVYTASDTGTRPRSALEQQFPLVDFASHLPKEDPWWYHHHKRRRTKSHKGQSEEEEWRPHREGQWYAVPGEPKDVFEERMVQFERWLRARPEQVIIVVSHWAICRHFFQGAQFHNCETRILTWWDDNKGDEEDKSNENNEMSSKL